MGKCMLRMKSSYEVPPIPNLSSSCHGEQVETFNRYNNKEFIYLFFPPLRFIFQSGDLHLSKKKQLPPCYEG